MVSAATLLPSQGQALGRYSLCIVAWSLSNAARLNPRLNPGVDTSFSLDALRDTLLKVLPDIFNTYGGAPADQIDWTGWHCGRFLRCAEGVARYGTIG